ncbi:hypothetical protein VNO78_26611 [Psophocarpus tetragonolobus]|uniref:Uncharacterized protein n=1 Tax=Psophocarpus tetragonolobus TaxID=3891 RepID=A0AAN9X9Y5_PSOTE
MRRSYSFSTAEVLSTSSRVASATILLQSFLASLTNNGNESIQFVVDDAPILAVVPLRFVPNPVTSSNKSRPKHQE